MGLLTVLLTLVIVGAVVYAINRWAPIDPKFKTIINYVAVIAAVLWLLSIFVPGLIGAFRDIPVK